MPDWVGEGINPSPTLDLMNPVLGYFRIKRPCPMGALRRAGKTDATCP
jgi:hypothetical protein